jgi:hypothetical protein
MKLNLYQRIAMNQDFPEQNLKKGDVAWLIEYVPHPKGGEEGAVLEVFNVFGDSMRVAVVPASAIEPIRADHMPSVRSLEQRG